MPSRRTTIFRVLPTAGIFAATMLLGPVAAEPPEIAPLTGQLLIAAPTIGDPRFAHTVILMVRHDREGAFGIVINRPVGESPIASLLEGAGEDVSGISGNVRIFRISARRDPRGRWTRGDDGEPAGPARHRA